MTSASKDRKLYRVYISDVHLKGESLKLSDTDFIAYSPSPEEAEQKIRTRLKKYEFKVSKIEEIV